MNDQDPMFRDAFIGGRRVVYFIAVSSVISVVLWALILLLKLHIDFGDLPLWWSSGWTPLEGRYLPQVMLYGCWFTGLQSTAIFYLVMWVRWLKRGNIDGYQRGAQIEQGRM